MILQAVLVTAWIYVKRKLFSSSSTGFRVLVEQLTAEVVSVNMVKSSPKRLGRIVSIYNESQYNIILTVNLNKEICAWHLSCALSSPFSS